MNYQYPLLNLISRGHLCVKNRIAMENFIKNLDNDSCRTILENLIYEPDTKACANKLDQLKESYELKLGIRQYVSESTLNNARDSILLREADNSNSQSTQDLANQLIQTAKAGAVGVVAWQLLTMEQGKRNEVLNAIKNISNNSYNAIVSNPMFSKVLPKDLGFGGRVAHDVWTHGNPNVQRKMNADDIAYIAKLKKVAGWSAAIAASIIGTVVLINILYKRYFSFAAKACKGLSGKKRTICMCKAIIVASEKAKAEAEKALLDCDSAKNPQECRFKLKVEIRSWTRKIEEQKRKLAKLEAVNSRAYGEGDGGSSTSNDPFA